VSIRTIIIAAAIAASCTSVVQAGDLPANAREQLWDALRADALAQGQRPQVRCDFGAASCATVLTWTRVSVLLQRYNRMVDGRVICLSKPERPFDRWCLGVAGGQQWSERSAAQ